MDIVKEIARITTEVNNVRDAINLLPRDMMIFQPPFLKFDVFFDETLYWALFHLKQRFARESLKIARI
jgi:hypothetical protein